MMKAEGYAGLTIAKVAARAGETKALISYHFGSKQGLVAAVGARAGRDDHRRGARARSSDAETVEELSARRSRSAIEEIADEDPRMPRLYFDLAAVSVVDPDVRDDDPGDQRRLARGASTSASGRVRRPEAPRPSRPAALLIMAGVQGMALERVERDPAPSSSRPASCSCARSRFAARAEPSGREQPLDLRGRQRPLAQHLPAPARPRSRSRRPPSTARRRARPRRSPGRLRPGSPHRRPEAVPGGLAAAVGAGLEERRIGRPPAGAVDQAHPEPLGVLAAGERVAALGVGDDQRHRARAAARRRRRACGGRGPRPARASPAG